ncbi:hypothetical protein BCR44DRAFT_256346 [Catenaria anguillulae PL171]|uniref:SH3 domain-containing protein n=1 Tax=Catenaria anguillulae PL171 TaxID=765915 RepID=A0A1Y2HKL8_9FUNG|nr:hypothetical protein BCR44DRAFT_256346 [Catenaria anguillulae PL171]
MQSFTVTIMSISTSTSSTPTTSRASGPPCLPCLGRPNSRTTPRKAAMMLAALALLVAYASLVEALPRAQIDLGQIPSMLPSALPTALPTALPPGIILPRPATATPTQAPQPSPAPPANSTSAVAPESALAPTATTGTQSGSSGGAPTDDSGLSVGAVVGIAAAILIIIGAAGIAWIRRAKRLALQQRRGSDGDPNKGLLSLSSIPPASRTTTTGDAPTVTITSPSSPPQLSAPAATAPNFLVSRLPSAPSISSNEEVAVPAIIVPPSPGITPSHAPTLPLGPTISPPPSSAPTNATCAPDIDPKTNTNTVSADRSTTASFPTLTPLPLVFRPDGTCGPLIDDRDFPITENTLASVRKGFIARANDEVALSPGDTVTIHSRFPDLWARGTRHPNGPSGPDAVTGFFPLGALDVGRTDTLLTQRSASLSRSSVKEAGESMSRGTEAAGSPPSNLSTSMTRDQVSGEVVVKAVAASS